MLTSFGKKGIMTIQRIDDCEAIKAHSGECLRDAMKRLDQTGMGIILLCEKDGRLLDTITDGDVRRAILDNVDLDAPLWQLYGRKVRAGEQPITASATSSLDEIEDQMVLARIEHLPLVDGRQCV